MTDDTTLTRAVAAAAGGTLLAIGLRRRSASGALAALAGGWLCYRALARPRRRARPADATGRERAEPGRADAASVERYVTIGADADDLYDRLRDTETLDRLVGGVAEVTPVDGDRHRWAVRAPLGRTLTWETSVVDDRPGERLRWEVEGLPLVAADGSVRLRPAPGDRGTEVALRVRVDPPGGAVGDAALSALGVVPGGLASAALRRFKSLVETGEIPTLEGNPSARGRGDLA